MIGDALGKAGEGGQTGRNKQARGSVETDRVRAWVTEARREGLPRRRQGSFCLNVAETFIR